MKFKQPASRFALVGVFVARRRGGVRVAVTGAQGARVPRHARSRTRWRRASRPSAAQGVKVPPTGINGDLHGSAAYRAAMISVMAQRAVAAALAR